MDEKNAAKGKGNKEFSAQKEELKNWGWKLQNTKIDKKSKNE